MGIVLIIVSSLIVSSTWWVVYFWDCPTLNEETSVAYYMVLKRGLCIDPDQGQENNFEDCVEWADVKDSTSDEEVKDGAQAYIDALHLGESATAFVVLFFGLSLLSLIPVLRKWNILRFAALASVVIAFFMYIGALGAASNTWFTDLSNYPYADAACGSKASFGYVGYVSAFIGLIVSIIAALVLLFPCCCCIESSTAAASEQSGHMQEPIHQTNPVLPTVVVATPIGNPAVMPGTVLKVSPPPSGITYASDR